VDCSEAYGQGVFVVVRYGAGTGGDMRPNTWSWNPVTPAITTMTHDLEVSPSMMLEAVRTAFGLNVKQAARVFNVERPTIYLWAMQGDFSRVRPQNRERMKTLYDLAKLWRSRGRLPNNALDAVFENFPSLIDMLSATQLDIDAILASHNRLQTMRGCLEEQQSTNARALGKAFGDAVASIGSPSEKSSKGLNAA